MADTPTDRTPDPGVPGRYMVLSDGETWEPLRGSKIIEIDDTLTGDEIDAAIKARCRENDPEGGKGITVLYTANGYEPKAGDVETTVALSGQMVRFHVDAGGPGGFIGTLTERHDSSDAQHRWLFHAAGRLIASASDIAIAQPPVVSVVDQHFLDEHEITNETLTALFQSALTAVQAPYLVLTERR
jgi:hypothetical protein